LFSTILSRAGARPSVVTAAQEANLSASCDIPKPHIRIEPCFLNDIAESILQRTAARLLKPGPLFLIEVERFFVQPCSAGLQGAGRDFRIAVTLSSNPDSPTPGSALNAKCMHV
jgi:hypothetical protein